TVFLIITFFVTSSVSGALVIDSLASGGAAQTPVWQRVFWAVIQGVLAAVLLVAGGLQALHAMTTTTALPFAIIMLLSAIGLWRAPVIEGHHEASVHGQLQKSRHGPGTSLWKKRLSGLIGFPRREQVEQFIDTT